METAITIRVSEEKKKKAKYILDTQGKTLSGALREVIYKLADEFDEKNNI